MMERMKVSDGCTAGEKEKEKDLGREAGLLNPDPLALWCLFDFSFSNGRLVVLRTNDQHARLA